MPEYCIVDTWAYLKKSVKFLRIIPPTSTILQYWEQILDNRVDS